jgi:hypothetical protein
VFFRYSDVILESNAAYQYERSYTLANGMLISQSDSIGTLYFLGDAQNSFWRGDFGFVCTFLTYDKGDRQNLILILVI